MNCPSPSDIFPRFLPTVHCPGTRPLCDPQVAMHFVKDNHIRFNLAIECGNLAVAKETAMELKNPDRAQRDPVTSGKERGGGCQAIEHMESGGFF